MAKDSFNEPWAYDKWLVIARIQMNALSLSILAEKPRPA